MKRVTLTEASENLSKLIDAALRGEEVIIAKGDRASIKLSPTTPAKSRQPGSAKGQVWMSKDFDEPLEEFKDHAKPRPKFGSAKGLIKINDDFDDPLENFKDYM